MKKENNNKLRIYMVLSGENLFHPFYLRGLIGEFKKLDYRIVGITIAAERYKKGFLDAVFDQIYLWGILGFTFIAINSLFRSTLQKLGLDSSKTIQGIAYKNKIPLKESICVNDQSHLDYLKKLKIDIIISSNGQIFKKNLLNIPKLACINRHTALLPQYGGGLPVFWAMKNKEKRFGISVHYMEEKVDKGDVLSQISIENKKDNSLFYNYMIAFVESIPATVSGIDNLLNNKIVRKFEHNNKEYFSFPKRADMVEFKKRNKSFNIIDTINFYKLLKI